MSLDPYIIKVSYDHTKGTVSYDHHDLHFKKRTTSITWVKADDTFVFQGITPPVNPFGPPAITEDAMTVLYAGKSSDRDLTYTYNVIVAPKENPTHVTTGVRPAASPTIRNH